MSKREAGLTAQYSSAEHTDISPGSISFFPKLACHFQGHLLYCTFTAQTRTLERKKKGFDKFRRETFPLSENAKKNE